jgi:hypothetical protein
MKDIKKIEAMDNLIKYYKKANLKIRKNIDEFCWDKLKINIKVEFPEHRRSDVGSKK